jgi:hypothetical protein
MEKKLVKIYWVSLFFKIIRDYRGGGGGGRRDDHDDRRDRDRSKYFFILSDTVQFF